MPADITIVPAHPRHFGRVAMRMRRPDVIECRAMGFTPKQALRQSFRSSSEMWTVLVDGRPEAVFGLTVTNALCGHAQPWLLGTDEVYRHPRELIRWGTAILGRWVDSFPLLTNLVSTGNDRAIRVLRRWGCKIGKEVIMSAGVEMVAFTLER